MFQVSLAPHPNQTFLPPLIICNWQLSRVKLWKHNITTLLHKTTIVVICSKSMCGEGKFKKLAEGMVSANPHNVFSADLQI